MPTIATSQFLHARRTHSWTSVCSGHTDSRDKGMVRGEASVTLRYQIFGEPVPRDDSRDRSFRSICVCDECVCCCHCCSRYVCIHVDSFYIELISCGSLI